MEICNSVGNSVYYLPEERQVDRLGSRWRSGFTLMEVLIVAVLIGVVGLSFGYLYVTAQRFTMQSMNFTTTQNEASFALEHIKRNVLLATAIARPAVGATTASLEFTWQPSSAVAARTSRYELGGANNTDLRFIPDITALGTFEAVARNVLSVTFTRSNISRLDIAVVSQSTSGSDTRQTRLQTTVSPRGVFQ